MILFFTERATSQYVRLTWFTHLMLQCLCLMSSVRLYNLRSFIASPKSTTLVGLQALVERMEVIILSDILEFSLILILHPRTMFL